MSFDFSGIHGNDHLKRIFIENISDNSLPHAIILEGRRGSGKYTFALTLASAVLCTDAARPCFGCKNCRQIFEGTAPDVHVVSLPDDKATISVEAVRFIRNDAQSVPVEGEFKFYIIKDCDKMTVQAQNALLKILEEPPGFVIFILLSENSNLLLPTIRSRAPVYRMQRFDDGAITDYILTSNKDAKRLYDADPEAFGHLVKSANGCIGILLENLDKRALNRASKEYEIVSGMFESVAGNDKAAFMSYEDEFPGKRDELRAMLCTIRSAARDILSVKKGKSGSLIFFASEENVRRLCVKFTLSSLLKIIDITDTALDSNELNANVNLLKINYMYSLWKCVH